jgi:hypothetical protein
MNETPEDQRDILVNALRSVVMNDKTQYKHHQTRTFDGKRPNEITAGNTIWLTPREIALRALAAVGVDVRDLS